jgi:acyl-coenzyme A synthetase/AMP-(fatty) acid ligase
MSRSDLYNIALDCIDKHARSLYTKHKTAMIFVREDFSVQRLTFSNLEGLTNRIANALRGLGLQAGERLLLRLCNGPEFPVTFLGAIKAGLIPIPTSPLQTWHELKFLLEDSEASVLVTSKELFPQELFLEKPPSLKQTLLLSEKNSPLPPGTLRWADLLKNAPPSFQTEPTAADAPAFWLYTSGTEGKPKAVIHSHRSIRAHDGRARVWQDLQKDDVVFNTSSLNWSYALTCGMLDLWRHGVTPLIDGGPSAPERIGDLIRRFGVTTFMSVPAIYRRLVESFENGEEKPFAKVRVCLSAGEKLPAGTRDRFRKATGLEIYEGLGMTEHSVYLVQPYHEPLVLGSCGRPVPGTRIAILRDDLTEAPAGETGILSSHRSCEGLMLGYHYKNPPSPPFDKGGLGGFHGDWFLSGDLASRDETGNFFFVGRRDDVITAGGYRISPLEIEAVLNQMEWVSESAAVGEELEPGKTIVSAFVVLREGTSPEKETAEKIKSLSAEKLAKYKIPRRILFVDSLPKTQSGKIKRNGLRTIRKG